MAYRPRTCLTAIVLFLCASAHAGTFVIFGPHDYRRTTGQPVSEHAVFPAHNTALTYRLQLRNGGAANTFAPVTSARVTLNGAEIFGPKDFNAKTPALLERNVSLTASNELTVEIGGEPGAGATLQILGEDNDLPVITATFDPPLNANGWLFTPPVTVTFSCTDASTEVTSCTSPVVVTAEGVTSVEGKAVDAAGNIAKITVSARIDTAPPAVTITAPHDGDVFGNSKTTVDIGGTFSDAGSGVSRVRCGATDATVSGSTFTCTVPLAAGPNPLAVSVTDAAGHAASASAVVVRDVELPVIALTAPAGGSRTNSASVLVSGSVSDDDDVASVKVNGIAAALSAGDFQLSLPLANGVNTIEVVATDRGGNAASKTLQVTRFTVPKVAITSPSDLANLRAATVSVSGTISEPAAITVNGVAASVSGTSFTAAGIPLAQGRTVLTATATTSGGASATDSVLVYRDSIPPRVVVRYPEDGSVVFQTPVDVTGMIDDIVVGTINSGQANITINGVVAEVSNRAFTAHDVPLTAGLNTLTIVATDQGGNATTLSSRVTYNAANGVAKIIAVSGGDQTATIGATLPQPLVVRLTDAAGAPAANHTVVWEIVENNGSITSGASTDRIVTSSTNAQGEASVRWNLGMRAGAGNNRVAVSSDGFAGRVEFSATARMGAAAMVVVDSGNNQFGASGAALPRPLVAVAVDAGNNRVAGVPVTFTVAEGGGDFDGQPSINVTTDGDGRAIVTPRLGNGAARNLFLARLPGDGKAIGFVANGKVAGPASETRISGVILDNTDLPIAGVSVRVDGTTLVTQADAQGQFTIEGAPVGYVKLLVDGSTAQRPGSWPTLEYAMYAIPGTTNTLEMPIYLLPVDLRRGLFVDEVTGGTLTLSELPGFSLTVKPGSATFPGGGRTGTISATLVHADKVPMAPGFGQQPRFIVTIQPSGVHFDPPVAMTFPNVDGLAPGEVTEMYSFDHDLGQFVSIGTASVSADGAILRSDPGVGIIKGGWHCGGNPAASGTAANCQECFICDGDTCKPDPARQNTICKGHDCKRCQGNAGCRPITNPNAPYSGSETIEFVFPPASDPMDPGDYGRTKPQDIVIQYTARCAGSRWVVELLGITGHYSIEAHLRPGQTEPQPPTEANYCSQIFSLRYLGEIGSRPVYMLAAVRAHEQVHKAELLPALTEAASSIEQAVESIGIGIEEAKTLGEAVQKLKSSTDKNPMLEAALETWKLYYESRIVLHHNQNPDGPAIAAERAIVDPVWMGMCATGKANGWSECTPKCP